MAFILSLDEGTTSARAALYDSEGRNIGMEFSAPVAADRDFIFARLRNAGCDAEHVLIVLAVTEADIDDRPALPARFCNNAFQIGQHLAIVHDLGETAGAYFPFWIDKIILHVADEQCSMAHNWNSLT